jgi:O-antigen/teichoic acid export membrane protein
MIAAVLANVAGFAVWFTYREVQRGQERYVTLGIFCILANVLQLIAIVAAGMLGFRYAALFLVIYGLSNLFALALMERVAPVSLRFRRAALEWRRLLGIARFIRPLVLATIFNALWMWIDLLLVQRLLPAAATGNYAAAKIAVNVLVLAPTAIGIAVGPRIARLADRHVARYLLRVLGLTAVATAPAVAGMILLKGPLTLMLFGTKYPDVARPITMLALGAGLYGFYLVFQSTWIGLGRPLIDSLASGTAVVSTSVAGVMLVPHAGLTGAATAFALGSAAQLLVIALFSLVVLGAGKRIHGATLEPPDLEPIPKAS